MSKKNIIVLAVTLLAVAGFYYFMYRDSFSRHYIQISHTIRPGRAKRPSGTPIDAENDNITFFLSRDYHLVSVKVVSEADLKTNKFPHPIWELVSDSNSVPIRAFNYGGHIKGMHSAVKGAVAANLDPTNSYRLLVEATNPQITGAHVFTIPEEQQ